MALPRVVLKVGPACLFMMLGRWGPMPQMEGAVFYHDYI
jgi:hypothetical protein